MQFQLRANHNHRASRIIDPLAEQILPEATLLAFQHVGQRFQRTLIAAGNHPTAPPIVEQRINRFLQHALFITHDNIGRAQFNQPLQTGYCG